jgi:diguanylate cyclase (GGDEF)-like protein
MAFIFSDATLSAQAGVPLWLLGLAGLACVGALLLALRMRGDSSRLSSRLDSATTEIGSLRGRDTLTGLITRPELEAALDRAAHACDTGDRHLALLYVNLDNFRPVNDGYGLRVGDAVLVEVAKRLTACVGDKPWASRVGGDEFVLLIEGDQQHAGKVAERVLAALQTPLRVEALDLQLSASVGVAVYPEDGSRPKLIPHAALAMRTVKLGGGSGYARFDPSMAVDMRGQAELLQDLRSAVERNQLRLFYQPKIDALSLQVTGAEALLRWEHPSRGMVSPAIFIPMAERHGLIGRIGLWVINEACRQAAEWRDQGLRMRVAVNISGHQMRQDDFVQHIVAAMQKHNVQPQRLTCEITESVAMEDTIHTRDAFERLRRAGLHVSIDDFGTGHSSLAALRKLPAAELKIDRAFVTDLATSEQARGIAKAIVQMARALGLRVVAEGVETEVQRDLLVGMGCDEMQGYLFARPMSAAALALWADNDGTSGDPTFRASLFSSTQAAQLGN